MSGLAEVLKNALSLDVHDRAALVERLLVSLDELSEEEAERLWAEEAQRRLDEYRAGRAKAVRADEKDGLLMLAVAHHSRRPGYWVGRVKSGDKETKGGA